MTDSQSPTVPIILGVTPTSGAAASLATNSNDLTLNGIAAPGTTVTLYDGSKVLGFVVTNAEGAWNIAIPALADGNNAFTATATASNGLTSAASAPVNVNVQADISSFSALTDQWSSPIKVGGSSYFVENANVNGNAPWAITEPNDHTLQFTLKPGDLWSDNDSHRTEIGGTTNYAASSTLNISYQLTVQPGLADTALSWQILGQVHADDNDPIVSTLTQDSPVFAFHLTGADGRGGGDYLAVQVMYLPSGSDTPVAATVPGNPNNGYLWVSSQPIVRGQAYSIQVEGSFQDNSSGFVEVWVNGTQVVDYHGPVGYGTSNYWKEGLYEGWTPTQTVSVDYANTMVTATPSAPTITNDVVNGNRAMLDGDAEANSKVSIYDGSTLLGTTTTAGDGEWSYDSGALSTGTHSFTAKATDSAGNVSAASLASSTTIAAFTGPIVTGVTSSAVSGEALPGQKITFTVAMSSAATVTGAPALTLSNGGSALYVSGSGTNALTFQYVVAAANSSVSGLSITGLSLPTGASITDSSGNAAILAGADQTFGNIVVDATPVSAPVFTSSTSNANGSITIKGTAAPNTIVHEIEQIYYGDDTLNLDGTAVVNASGSWTYTTPSLLNGSWYNFTAYDTNSLGDISATSTSNGVGVSTKELPSPVILSNSVSGGAATLSGVIPANYGATGPSGATVLIFDGSTQIGSVTTTSGGNWSFTSGELANGTHSFSVESKNASGASANSLPVSIAITQGLSQSVTVAEYLANQATLDAAGAITLDDTAPNVAAAINTINADTHVSAITLLGSTTLNLNVAQALGDTHALNAITNSNYGITVTDTGANVSANFDALNSDSHITTILPTGGSQTLTLTISQMMKDTHALSLLDPFEITVTGAAANLDTLTTSQISNFAANSVTAIQATDTGLALTLAQAAALGAGGISIIEPFAAGTTEEFTYNANGGIATILYQGVTGQAYTSYTVTYGSNGKPASISYSNGMTAAWSYNANGTYVIALKGVTGQAFTSYTINYGANGKPTSATYGNGATETWTYNANGTYVIALQGVTGQIYTSYTIDHGANGALTSATFSGITSRAYTSYTVDYGANGKPTSVVYSNGATETWTYNANGTYVIALKGVTGQIYTSYTADYGASGALTSATFSGITGRAFTSYTVDYGANGKPTNGTYSNGLTETWTYNADGTYSVSFPGMSGQIYASYTADFSASGALTSATFSGITGRAFTSYTVDYGANGKPTNATYSNGLTETWTYNADGTYAVSFRGVSGQAYTSYTVDYGTNGKPTNATYSNGMTETWAYHTDGSSLIATRGITGASYSATEAIFNAAGVRIAATDDFTNGAGFLLLSDDGLAVSSGAGGALSLTAGSDTFALEAHTKETINATGYNSEVFGFASGFGAESITGFTAAASGSDVLSLKLSMFNGLSASDTAAQNAAILLSSHAMSQSGSNVTITDTSGDVLTLVGATTSALTQYASSVFKFG